ncbi:hypothetical protein JCM10212_005212 [Sporobolomyces blumeae]
MSDIRVAGSTRSLRVPRIVILAAVVLLGYQIVYRFSPSASTSFNLVVPVEDDFGTVGQVEGGRKTTFRSYLQSLDEDGLPEQVSRRHLWLTVSDRNLARSTTPVLEAFVDTLILQRRQNATLAEDEHARAYEQVQLIVLCGDAWCLEESVRRNWAAYGGYRLTKPDGVGINEWMKLSGILDALHAGEDVVFVDPSIFLIQDPYPFLDPARDSSDMIVAETPLSAGSNLVSSGFVWSRSAESTIEIWTRLIHSYAATGATEHETLNSLLFTRDNRGVSPVDGQPRSEFESPGGVKVNVLSRDVFVPWRPAHDLVPEPVPLTDDETVASGKSPVAIQLGCGGDAVGAYGSAPSRVLRVPTLVGTRDELKQILKILVTTAKMTGRALQLPSHVTILDIRSPSDPASPIVLPTYAAFPLPHLAAALDIALVEPSYTSRTLSALGHASPEDASASKIIDELEEYLGEIDVRTIASVADLVKKLSLISYSIERVVSLTHFGSTRTTWRKWHVLRTTRIVQPCRKLEGPVLCGELCRLPASWKAGISDEDRMSVVDEGELVVREMKKRIEEPWPALDDFLEEARRDPDWDLE